MEEGTGRDPGRRPGLNLKIRYKMKRLLFLLPLVLFVMVSGCNNSADTEVEETDSVEIEPMTYLWQADMNDSTGKMVLTKDKPAGLDSLAVGPIIEFLNQTNPNVILEFVKASSDTVFVKIPDANYFTQQMGSTGPAYYFATAVYNLTEIPGIRFVSFDFEEGDHASPGTFTRERFKDL